MPAQAPQPPWKQSDTMISGSGNLSAQTALSIRMESDTIRNVSPAHGRMVDLRRYQLPAFGRHPSTAERTCFMTRFLKPAAWFISFVFLTLCPRLSAQSSSTQDPQSGAVPGGVVTNPLQIAVTGCLQRGGESGGYYISDQNGTTWKLTSSTVNLAEHLSHSVMVTGKPIATPQQQGNNGDGQGGKTEGGSKPQPSLRVLTLKMLSPSCTR